MNRLDVDELDFPLGLRAQQYKEVASINAIEQINKKDYVNSWLSSKHIKSEGKCDGYLLNNQLHGEQSTTHRTSTIAYTSVSTSSAHTSNSESLSNQKPMIVIPAGYKDPEEISKRRMDYLIKKQSQLSQSFADSSKTTAIGKLESENDKQASNAIVEEIIDKENVQTDSDWERIFENQEKYLKLNSISNQNCMKHVKQSLGLCFCKECSREIPTKLIPAEPEKFEKRQAPERKRAGLLMRSNSTLEGNVMTSSPRSNKSLDSNKMAVLTHGLIVPTPQDDINKTHLVPYVQKQLKEEGFENSKPIQSFGWPSMLRYSNVVTIHKKQTGKTLTYISAVCSLLADQKIRVYDDIPNNNRSPLVIILTNNASVALDVLGKMRRMLKGQQILNNLWNPVLPLSQKVVSDFFGRKTDFFNGKQSRHKHRRSLDILITTVDTLIALLQNKIIDLKRLHHLIVENVDIILAKLGPRFESVLHAVDSMLTNRNSFNGVQFIATGEKWTKALERFVSKIRDFPLIIIGDHMQAALYGRAQWEIQHLKSSHKAEALTALLKKGMYNIYKCIVICKIKEVGIIQQYFILAGINFVVITDDMSGGEIVDLIMAWKTTTNGKHMVLICTDKALRQYVKVSNATFLVNYSLPPTWSMFSQRFSTLTDSYQCPFVSNKENSFYCRVVTYVDEKCMDRFPRLCNFFTSNNIKVPDELLQYCAAEKRKAEIEKVKLNVPLCESLYKFGSCSVPECKQRHILSNKLETALNYPRCGRIKCKIIDMRAINCYYVQILEFQDINGEFETLYDTPGIIAKKISEIPVFEIASDAIKGKMYVVAINNVYCRCIITAIKKYMSVGDTMTSDPLEVEIFGVDNGAKSVVNVNVLHVVPECLSNIPPGGVELYIANMIPPFKESLWTRNATTMVISQLKSFNKSSVCTGNILLRLNYHIWVDDLTIMEMNTPFPNKMSITQFLKDKNIYAKSEDSLNNLYALCKDADIALPEFKILEEVRMEQPKIKRFEPAWAHLLLDELNAVYFSSATSSDCIYIKHIKFYSLLEKLEAEIAANKHLIARKLKPSELVEGLYYSVLDDISESWCRGLLLSAGDGIAHVFFVDYGHTEPVDVEKIRLLPNEFLTRLPFQAIECSLYGIKPTKSPELLNDLYNISYEPNTYYFKIMYALYISEQKTETLPVSGRNNYQVVLIDYYGDKTDSINNQLLKNKVAEVLPSDPLSNIKLPCRPETSNYTNSNSECTIDDNTSSEVNHEIDELINDDEFDFIGEGCSFEDANCNGNKEPRPENNPPEKHNGYIQIKAAAESDSIELLPKVSWYQTDTHVFMEFAFIENNDYKLGVSRKRFLMFKSIYQGKCYSLTLNLYDQVSKYQHESKPYFILLTLTKYSNLEWPRLTKSEEKMLNIKYKIDKIYVDSDVSEEEDNVLQSKDIDDKYFANGVITADGKLEEIFSDTDSGSDCEAIAED